MEQSDTRVAEFYDLKGYACGKYNCFRDWYQTYANLDSWLVGSVLICSNCMFADKRVSVSMSGYNSIVCCWGFFLKRIYMFWHSIPVDQTDSHGCRCCCRSSTSTAICIDSLVYLRILILIPLFRFSCASVGFYFDVNIFSTSLFTQRHLKHIHTQKCYVVYSVYAVRL